MRSNSFHRSPLAAITAGGALVLMLAACGGGSGASSQVASLGGDNASSSATESTVAADSQQQWIDFAQCMRDNGVDMQDPTFDADGNVQGGFGPESGLDMRSDDTRTAMEACSDLLPAGGPGGAGGAAFDRTAIQEAFTSFTACLRDEGLDVDDIDFAAGPGGDRPDGPPPSGAVPQPGSDGGFQGGPPPDRAGNGEGFDPTTRIIEQLGLDTTDPAVTAAVDVCSSTLDGALGGPNASTSATTEPGQ